MKTLRCAVYTRKSSEEGLELSFNSLHAQREACEAYVLSQAGEGWTCLSTQYDDGGISGGHLERPGLKALIEDIKQGKVDIIVVYKVDRLTRSLTDFSKLVEVFDEHGVSFVSVTQAFNTTNSMGRLTLNVLLSFAQFEREVTGERIRDKIAMSRKRGLWTGGLPPLGYDVVDKKLTVNSVEASAVKHIFNRYNDLKNVRLLQTELKRDGYVSKRRTTKTGRASGGKSFERGALYAILKNKTYLGLTTHKGESYDGVHDAIIDEDTFETVQRVLAANRRISKHKTGAKDPSLLAGKIVTQDGIILTPTHAQTHGRRYRYYVERRRGEQINLTSKPIRLPASEIEQSVCLEMATYLADPIKLTDDLEHDQSPQEMQERIHEKSRALAEKLKQPTLKDVERTFFMTIVKRIALAADANGYDLTLDLQKLVTALEVPINTQVTTVTLDVICELRTCNNGKKRIIGNTPEIKPDPNPVLIDMLKTAHWIKDCFMGTDGKSISAIATQLNMNSRQVGRTLRLAFLAPDIQLAILSGTQPKGLVLKDLIYQTTPVLWTNQRRLFGFS